MPVRGVIAGGGGNCLGRVDMGGTRKRNALGGGGASAAGPEGFGSLLKGVGTPDD